MTLSGSLLECPPSMFVKDIGWWELKLLLALHYLWELSSLQVPSHSLPISCSCTPQAVLRHRSKTTTVQILSIFYIAHSSHPRPFKFLFLPPQSSDITMLGLVCVVVQKVPAGRRMNYHRVYLICFFSLRSHRTAQPAVQYLKGLVS